MCLPGDPRDDESHHQVDSQHDEQLFAVAAEAALDHEEGAHEAEDRSGCPDHGRRRSEQQHREGTAESA